MYYHFIKIICDDVNNVNQLILCSPGKIELWYKNKALYLLQTNGSSCISSLWDAILRMQDGLEAALKGELEVPADWPSVGYMLNKYFEDPIEYKAKQKHKPLYYLLLSLVQTPATLLYNKNGDIVLQIAPIFDSSINKIPYKVFIRNYRPYLTRTISHKTAQGWLEQVVKLRKIMLDNYERDKANMTEEPWSPKESTTSK